MTTSTRSRSQKQVYVPDYKTKRIRLLKIRLVQKQAFNELLVQRNANGGTLPYGAIVTMVKDYNERGFSEVTERNLRYRMDMLA
jgi:hypothetical protein